MITVQLEIHNGTTWIEKNVSLETEEDFGIDEQDLDKELCRMAQLLLRYGDLWSDFKAQQARYEEEVDSLYAYKALKCRSTLDKATEGKIKETINSDEEYRELFKKMLKTKAYTNKLEIMYKSLLRKSDCLIALSYKHRHEMKSY